jgi:hypothetical protein
LIFILSKSTKKCDFNIDKLKSNEWNPAEYNVSGAFAEIFKQ